jgi:protein-disulfide isomerase
MHPVSSSTRLSTPVHFAAQRALVRRIAAVAVVTAALGLAGCVPAGTLTPEEGRALKTEVAALRVQVGQLETTVKQLSSRTAAPAEPAVVALADTTDAARRLGRADAPVVIIEFSDLQCPYCRRFDQQTLPWLRKEYIDTGKVRYESRDYPLEFHAQAMAAALLARCAAREGKFWELREAVFGVQGSLATDGLEQAAKAVGLSAEQRAQCAKDDATTTQTIRTETAAAQAIGIRGTPSFLVGRVANGKIEGTLLVGAGLPETFRKRIEPLLTPAAKPQTTAP